jgi:RNA polymerase sigma-70 factor (ECF subfamily)
MQQPPQNRQTNSDRADGDLATVMLAAFSESGAPAPPAAGAALEALFAAGRRQWPLLAVDGAALARHLGRQFAPDTADVVSSLGVLNAGDLYLAAACALGVPGALETFDRACVDAIDGTIAGVDRTPSFRKEVRQALHERLFVGTADAPPRIGSYAGRGPLAAWVAIVTQRLALQLRRTEQTRVRIEDRAANEPPPQPDDPELAYLKQRYRDEFESAYRAALQALPERDRTLLRLHLFERVTLDRLAAMYAVDASTVSRWIQKARAAIRDATEDRLRDQLRVSTGEFASLARLVVSQLDVSIVALFEQPQRHRS